MTARRKRRWSDPALRVALAAQQRSTAEWERLSPAEREARWAEVRRRQREAMPEYRRWLWAGCPTTKKPGSP
jgi:hypothetical protein